MTFCQSQTIVKTFGTHYEVAPLRCRCWHCPDCVGMRLAQLADLCRRGQPTTFLTFTIRAQDDDRQAERAQLIKRAWTNLRRVICRKFKLKSLPFIAIFEQTKRGEPHLHILARMPFVDQKWLSQYWEQATGAFRVDIRKVRSQAGVAKYVSKYVSKAPTMWAGTKRYWRSLDWIVEKALDIAKPIMDFLSWFRIEVHHSIVIDRYVDMGWKATWTGRKWYTWGPEAAGPPI